MLQTKSSDVVISNSHNCLTYTQTWKNFSIRMLIKTSIGFFLPEEGYLNIRYHAGHDGDILSRVSLIHEQ